MTLINNKHALFFNSLPKDKILDVSQFKASAEDQVNVAQNLNLFWKR